MRSQPQAELTCRSLLPSGYWRERRGIRNGNSNVTDRVVTR